MYSRRFDGGAEVPAGYGGTAFTGRQKEAPDAARTPPGGETASEASAEFFMPERDGGETENGRRAMRRPSYTPPRPPKEEKRVERPSLLPGRSVSLEDVILAGVLLLLIAEGREKGEQDKELLLILGMLLFMKG